MKTSRTSLGILASLLVAGSAVLATPAAQAHVSINIEASLPGLFLPLPAPPPMVWMPNLGIYVARGTSEPMFYREGNYYIRHRDGWYSSQEYGGPWRVVPFRMLPPPLRGYHRDDWHRYQRDVDERFGRRGPDMPAPFYPRPRDRGEHRGWDHHRGDWHGRDGRDGRDWHDRRDHQDGGDRFQRGNDH